MAIKSGKPRGTRTGFWSSLRDLRGLRSGAPWLTFASRSRKAAAKAREHREERETAETIELSSEELARINEICASEPVVTDTMREAALKPWKPAAS